MANESAQIPGAAANTKSVARFQKLMSEDAQFAAAAPLASVIEAKLKPSLRIAQVVQIVMDGYADRPALGRRARELVVDDSGRKTVRLLPKFDMLTYRELWARAGAAAHAFANDPNVRLKAGDFVCILGFTSPDYAAILLANIRLGAVNVPLQTSAPTAQHAAIIAETEPRVLAVSIDYVDAAVSAVLAGVKPKLLAVLDYDERDDDQREKFSAAQSKLASAGVAVLPLEDLIAEGAAFRHPPCTSRRQAMTLWLGCSTPRAQPAHRRAPYSPRASLYKPGWLRLRTPLSR